MFPQDDFLNLEAERSGCGEQNADSKPQFNFTDRFERNFLEGTSNGKLDIHAISKNLFDQEGHTQHENRSLDSSNTGFCDLIQTPDDKLHSKMSNWDEDV